MSRTSSPRRIAWAERFLASRIDVDANTTKNYRSALRKIGETFGDRDPATITATEVAEWIASMAETRKPGTLGQYLIAFRLLLDHVGLEENVARDPRVKLPKQVREEPNPPSAEHTEAILEALGEKWRLLFVTIEQGALRLGEAVGLRWADVDAAGLRLRLPARRRSETEPGGSTCPSGSWTRSKAPARSRIASPSARCSRGSRRRRRTRRCRGRAGTRRCRTTTRMTCGTGGSRSGISRASRLGSSRSAQGTRGRR
jgi:integrase